MQDRSKTDIDADHVIGPVLEGDVPSPNYRVADAKPRIASRKNAGRMTHRRFFWGNGQKRTTACSPMARKAFISVREAASACADE